MRHLLTPVLATVLSALLCNPAAAEANPEQEPASTEQEAPAPFAYPSSALAARPTFSVSPATPAKLGDTLVVFEHSRIEDIALIANAPIHSDREGGIARQWVCIQATHNKEPVRLWFISSSDGRVNEAQMESGSFEPRQQFCGRLPAYFSPVSLSMISIGDRVRMIEQNIGPASMKEGGWSYWVSRKGYVFEGQRLTEYVWVGARTAGNGRIDRVFATQLTQ
jgi:hypothetical protein